MAMTLDLAVAGAVFLAGAAAGWMLAAPGVSPQPAHPASTAVPKESPLRCAPGSPDGSLEHIREARRTLEQKNRWLEGSIAMDFGPPLVQPEQGFDTDEVRATLERTLTLGTLHYSSCDRYPCAGIWDVSDEDLDAADAQLMALRALYPDATTSWWQDASQYIATYPPGQVPFIIHGPIDWDISADQNAENSVGRVRWMSRVLKAEIIYRLGPDAVLNGVLEPSTDQGRIPRMPPL